MRTDLFDYHLPEELIAVRPPAARDGGRMCTISPTAPIHDFVRNFPEQVEAGDLVVLNDTRVRRARLLCQRAGSAQGAKVELLFLQPEGPENWLALGRANRPLRPGDDLRAGSLLITIRDKRADGTLVVVADGDVDAFLEDEGTMPIPPYMRRSGDAEDVERYQTVFAQNLGSAAAPTAGLHLTEKAIERLLERGATLAHVTLHVGVGTFRPVSAADLDEHPMHSESIEVSEAVCEAVRATRRRGGRVVAVGTTAVRALESARAETPGIVRPTRENTNLLIQPGYRFSVVDALLTNFHQPKSTLLALVSAFAGRERILEAYREAVEQRYRFLSYGDAMWIPQCLAEECLAEECLAEECLGEDE